MESNKEIIKLLNRLDNILNDDEKHDEFYCLDKAREFVATKLAKLQEKEEKL